MTIIRFTDGISFDTSGPVRIESRADGLYIVGQGLLLPVDDRDEAERVLREMRREEDR